MPATSKGHSKLLSWDVLAGLWGHQEQEPDVGCIQTSALNVTLLPAYLAVQPYKPVSLGSWLGIDPFSFVLCLSPFSCLLLVAASSEGLRNWSSSPLCLWYLCRLAPSWGLAPSCAKTIVTK